MILFTHKDLDGVGCAVLFHKVFPTATVVFTNYDEVDEHVLMNLHHDKIWITDLSIKPETLQKAYELCPDLDKRINVVDHHKTALWLDKYDWALIDTTMCGAKLLFNLLSIDYHIDDMRLFADLVNDHDLWKHQMVGSAEMSDLLYVMGLRPYFERLCNDCRCKVGEGLIMTEGEKLLLSTDRYKFTEYFAKVTDKAQLLSLGEHLCVTAFADQYQSEICSKILDTDESVEAVFLIDMIQGKVSMRSRGNFDCSDYAKMNGGGGHPKAAGFPFDNMLMMAQMWGLKGYES